MNKSIKSFVFGVQRNNNFVAEFDTTIPGVTGIGNLRLPITNTKPGGIVIDWGDGTQTNVPSNSQVNHTYSVAGIYKVTIKGSFGFQFAYAGDRAKIGIVYNWGEFNFGSSTGHFAGCSNLRLEYVVGVPLIIGTLNQAFANCSSLTTIHGLQYWNTSNVLDFRMVFAGCVNFNDSNISSLPISGNISQMFQNTTNFNQPLNFGTIISATEAFRGSAFNHDISHATFDKNCLVTNMLTGKTPSTYNAVHLANLYIKFASSFVGVGRTATKNFSASSAKYDSSGASARAMLVADGWTVTDGGMI